MELSTEQLKEAMKQILKESGKPEISVTDDGDVQSVLSIDDEVIIESNVIDVRYEIEMAKTAKEARAWV